MEIFIRRASRGKSLSARRSRIFVTSLKWKSRTFSRNHHLERFFPGRPRTAGPSISTFESISITFWLNRKFSDSSAIRPFSTRNVPSRVNARRILCVRIHFAYIPPRVTRIRAPVERSCHPPIYRRRKKPNSRCLAQMRRQCKAVTRRFRFFSWPLARVLHQILWNAAIHQQDFLPGQPLAS